MSLKNDRYTYRVTWSDDDNEYVGLCAEFPSLSWLASTPEAALKAIRKVVADSAEDIRSEGETAPTPIAGKIIAANLWYAYRRSFIVSLPFKLQNLGSA